MKLGILFSGGKDSVFACYLAKKKHTISCLITLASENEESYMFHTPNIDITSLQAKAMEIPHLVYTTKGEKEIELDDLTAAIVKAKNKYGIEGIVTGAIESVYQATRVQKICNSLDIWCFNPLWQLNQVDYLWLLEKEGFSTIISGVFAYPFDESWLGSVIDSSKIKHLVELQEKYKINPSGEGGEIETCVIDCPMFKKKIEIVRFSTKYDNYSGNYFIEEARLVEK